ncbi:GATOR2-SEACAT complex WD repeat subunit Seh1 [Schizosaccharomyces osmophilus]|uniref:GATOR2-SEACAT complex WD repeat subunit Seh1 n=1 Tax=Schizosaccharomyces osmophilus TaxID=2545709 RepID=A0AAE9WBH3_9SCHI|nr:GATOR2-SEACAT complex WD repeat subunit Seh1 [Schizosaccharomyces osmophilus]WBW73140.1 GATOR2-SEACAT complex WD repeat subunit Seh1 [Schizosaccharomyces osmophilus]
MDKVESTTIETNHKDLINDVSYDFYGRRMASCSADQRVKVYDFDEESENWKISSEWRAGDASLMRIEWAHPEFGQVLAVCSLDRGVRVYQEQKGGLHTKAWVEVAKLMDARSAVLDISFCPIQHGCKLAAISADATLRIYEALEPENISSWTLMDEIKLLPSPPSRNEQSSFCVSWCPSRWRTQCVAVGCMDKAYLYTQNASAKWKQIASLPGHADLVRDIAWAPSMGRLYHLLATASKDGNVRIFKVSIPLQPNQTNSFEYESPAETTHEPIKVELIGEYDNHKCQVWRCQFNVTGTILSTSGDDGCIRLWKASYANLFKCISVVSLERKPERAV